MTAVKGCFITLHTLYVYENRQKGRSMNYLKSMHLLFGLKGALGEYVNINLE